jgi:Bifunctional DNA primase/polymerase, N-terminal
VTVLDIDTHDDTILAEALREHGETPLVVRTGGGYHAYYRHGGEPRRIRPYQNKPLDILGGGYVVAPPSISEKGQYEIVAGTLDDLADLPPIHVVLDGLRQVQKSIAVGERNNTLYRFGLQQAIHADDYHTLLDVMRTRNMDCETPLPDSSIISITNSAWRCEQEGRNLVGRGRAVVMPHALIDELIGESQDAFILLTLLRRHHWGRDCVVANAMAEQLVWPRKRFAAARALLLDRGFLELVRSGGYRFPPVFRLSAWGGRN